MQAGAKRRALASKSEDLNSATQRGWYARELYAAGRHRASALVRADAGAVTLAQKNDGGSRTCRNC
eukprot:6201593-Pleurochrysis_carterae.AAC.1